MSQWTHVSGCIRIDGMPTVLGVRNPMHNYEAVLGTPSSNAFDIHDRKPYRAAKDIPTGSEGSIQYAVSEAGTGLVWKTVAVWGDLRDFGQEDTPEIDAWFRRIVESPLMLRGAHLLVEVEGGLRYLLVADDKAVRCVELRAPADDAPMTDSEFLNRVTSPPNLGAFNSTAHPTVHRALLDLQSAVSEWHRAALATPRVVDYERERIAGQVIREAVDHDAEKMRFYLTCSVGELAQRVAVALVSPRVDPPKLADLWGIAPELAAAPRVETEGDAAPIGMCPLCREQIAIGVGYVHLCAGMVRRPPTVDPKEGT